MKKQLTIEEKQEELLKALQEGEVEHPQGYAIFGIEKEVVKPLIASGVLHKDTFRYTGGAKLTQKGRDYLKMVKNENI